MYVVYEENPQRRAVPPSAISNRLGRTKHITWVLQNTCMYITLVNTFSYRSWQSNLSWAMQNTLRDGTETSVRPTPRRLATCVKKHIANAVRLCNFFLGLYSNCNSCTVACRIGVRFFAHTTFLRTDLARRLSTRFIRPWFSTSGHAAANRGYRG